jgi:hypothetical protein
MGRTACTEPQCLYKGALYKHKEIKTTSLVADTIFRLCNRTVGRDTKVRINCNILNRLRQINLGGIIIWLPFRHAV